MAVQPLKILQVPVMVMPLIAATKNTLYLLDQLHCLASWL